MLDKLTKMFENIPNNLNLDYYVFVSSYSLKCEIKKFNGFKVYYDKRLKGDVIYFMQSPYAKDYNL